MTGNGGVRVVHAKDGSPAAVREAMLRAASMTKPGMFGPINAPAILIPGGKRYAGPAADVQARRDQLRPAADTLPRIRAARRSIAGYAAVFGVRSQGGEAIVAPGAFRDVIASRQTIYLFLDHPTEAGAKPSLASTTAGTLYLEEDRRGLWFEAALREDAEGIDVYRRVLYGMASGVSWGSDGATCTTSQGVRTFTSLKAWEISVLTASQPRFTGTWADVNVVARGRRARLG